MKRILLIQTAFIGDVILATALIEELHILYPDAKIDILLRKGAEGLFAGHPFIGDVLVLDKSRSKWTQLWKLLWRIRKKHYDLLVNCQRFASSGFLSAFSGAGRISGFRKNPFSRLFTHRYPHEIGNGQHEVERNRLLISFLSPQKACNPRLYPPALDWAPSAPYICIAPASVWFTKQWPLHKWIELVSLIPDNTSVYLLGSGADHALCEKIIRESARANVINLSGKLNLLQSATLMKGARMNYVNDSAPLHLCSAVNAPVKAIFCSTVPGFGFGPLSDQSSIVEIPAPLYCRPCGLHGYKACPEGHFRCAEEIDARQAI